MTDRPADLGQQSEPRYCLRDWLCMCVGMCVMLCLCVSQWAEGAFVGVCVSVVFVWKDCVVCGTLCVCVLVGWGVDCMSECEYVSAVKGQTRRIPL